MEPEPEEEPEREPDERPEPVDRGQRVPGEQVPALVGGGEHGGEQDGHGRPCQQRAILGSLSPLRCTPPPARWLRAGGGASPTLYSRFIDVERGVRLDST